MTQEFRKKVANLGWGEESRSFWKHKFSLFFHWTGTWFIWNCWSLLIYPALPVTKNEEEKIHSVYGWKSLNLFTLFHLPLNVSDTPVCLSSTHKKRNLYNRCRAQNARMKDLLLAWWIEQKVVCNFIYHK
jgi:hypothetical protein